MRRNLFIFVVLIFLCKHSFSQLNYYQDANGKNGEALKSALHEIIKGHTEYTYSQLWELMKSTDEDPANTDNVILIYTGRTQNKAFRDRGSEYDYEGAGYAYQDSWNREHVWSKSHGNFGTEIGAGTDLHHIRPADHSVNNDRYTKDFDNGGNPHSEASECNYDSDSWEPRDEVKGDIARMMFYMSVRYEGNGEPDLELVDRVTDYPNPVFGVLSTLIEWNQQDPPDDFERRRNLITYQYQGNRNPFIDHPEYVNMIWGENSINDIEFTNISMTPEKPEAGTNVDINAALIINNDQITGAEIIWGTSYYEINNTISAVIDGNNISATIPAQDEGVEVYYQLKVSTDNNDFYTMLNTYKIPIDFEDKLVAISEIQGQADVSPFDSKEVSLKGIVTGVFGNSFYLQDGAGGWNGLYVYNSNTIPDVGDEIIITGEIDEYYTLTELKNLSYFHLLSKNNPLPTPVELSSTDLTPSNPEVEQYESVLVKVSNAECLEDVQEYGLWKIDDGSGACLVHNPEGLDYNPTVGEKYSITGIATYTYSEWKIDIRNEYDVEQAADVTPPSIIEYELIDAENLTLYFSEEIEKTSAEAIENYQISNNVTIVAASLHTFQKNRVNLTLSGLTEGNYQLTVNGVSDLVGNQSQNLILDFTSTYVSIQAQKPFVFNLYPNPANDGFWIQLKHQINEMTDISLYDISGKCICYFPDVRIGKEKKILYLDLHDFEKGLYFVRISINNELYIRKLIVD